MASSHREAPMIAGMPRVDGSDFYMFNSYETGRGSFVTLIANYVPLQDAYGGPNYFKLDPSALYEIHIDNSGDAAEDLTFQFRFTNTYKGLAVPTGASANVAVPLSHRSEEHTSELQSLMRLSYAVFCLKKKKTLLTQRQLGYKQQKNSYYILHQITL